jgi:hypothetical protein
MALGEHNHKSTNNKDGESTLRIVNGLRQPWSRNNKNDGDHDHEARNKQLVLKQDPKRIQSIINTQNSQSKKHMKKSWSSLYFSLMRHHIHANI